MKPGDHLRTPTMSEVIRRAVSACDPENRSESVVGLLEAYEDDDRPALGLEDLEGELRSTAEALDPDATEPEVWVAVAAARWLAGNPKDLDKPDNAIQEGSRLFFRDQAPESVERWLVTRGLD